MDKLMQDLRCGVRMLRKNPAFTAIVVLVLALGSGANTVIFSILNAVVLRPLPYSEPGRLYYMSSLTSRGPRWISPADFETWRERTQVFEKIAAALPQRFILSGVDEPEHLSGLSVTQDCFPMLGIPPLLGRWLGSEDFSAGATQAVILGYGVWQRRFHGDPGLIGKLVLMDGKSYAVIGIMPPDFQFDFREAEFWVPLSFSPRLLSRRDVGIVQLFARAKKGVTLKQVQAESDSITRMLTAQFPNAHKGWRAAVVPLKEYMVTDVRPTLLLLLGAVGFVLLIACLNIANLLLARGAERSQEVAVRLALIDSNESEDSLENARTYPFRAVSPGYFQAMGIPVLAGRAFREADAAEAPRVAIVNELMARQLWPGQNPIGRQIQLDAWVPVVGVVGDIRHNGLSKKPQAELFLPYLQWLGVPQSALVVRTRLDPMETAPAIRKKIQQLQPDQPVSDLRTLEQLVADSIAQPRLYTLLLSIFAALALVLASVGIYGVMSYSVAQRFQEIGIRMALGAGKGDILREFVGQGMKYVLLGLAIGLAGALAATRLLAAHLFDVKETDPATYLSVSVLLLISALAAISRPASRAAAVDPLAALRHE